MTILSKLNIRRPKDSGIKDFCIQTIRFKKLLENANALLDLYEDGCEKIRGEYILDRHYVISLVDGIIEKLGRIVYDACTLAPEHGETLYTQFDENKLRAEDLISGNINHRHLNTLVDKNTESAVFTDPEYQLLSDVLSWFNGGEAVTVMDLMKKACIDGIYGIEASEILKKGMASECINFRDSGNRVYMIDLWKDALSPLKTARSLDNIESIPLKLLLLEHLSKGDSAKHENRVSGDFIVAASEYEVSLMSINSNFYFRLDATASGYEKSDYIFVYTDNRLSPEKLLPKGFHKEKTESGFLCWRLDALPKAIEDSLIAIGRHIFG